MLLQSLHLLPCTSQSFRSVSFFIFDVSSYALFPFPLSFPFSSDFFYLFVLTR